MKYFAIALFALSLSLPTTSFGYTAGGPGDGPSAEEILKQFKEEWKEGTKAGGRWGRPVGIPKADAKRGLEAAKKRVGAKKPSGHWARIMAAIVEALRKL